MSKITKTGFGQTKNGQNVFIYTIENSCGAQLDVITYGAAIAAFRLPLESGITDVILGYDTISDYEKQDKYMGATIGRFANRISDGKFVLNGRQYALYCNNFGNHLNGGENGFDKKLWSVEEREDNLCLTYFSPDGEEGYPGDLLTQVCYGLSDNNELVITITAQAAEDTIVNITNHSYFNLDGHNKGKILNHTLQIFAQEFTENNALGIPTGSILHLEGTPLDFSVPKKIGAEINKASTQLKNASGYDHNYVINKEHQNPLTLAAKAFCEENGVEMEVFTTQAGLQFYSGNFLDGEVKGKAGAVYDKNSGFCLEAQGFPNSTEFSHFPSAVLKKGDVYTQKIIYKFNMH